MYIPTRKIREQLNQNVHMPYNTADTEKQCTNKSVKRAELNCR